MAESMDDLASIDGRRLRRLLNDEDAQPILRAEAARAIAEVGDRRAIPGLLDALIDESHELAYAAAEALAALGDEAEESLVRVLVSGPSPALAMVGYALRRAARRRIYDSILPLLDSPESERRAAAAQALIGVKDILAAAPLQRRLKDSDVLVRSYAAEALGLLGDRSAAPALIAALGDPRPQVCREAAFALSRLKASAGAVPLVRAAQHGNAGVRQAAVEALGDLGDPCAFWPLVAALERDEPRIRAVAAAALGKLGDKRALPALLSAAKDPGFIGQSPSAEALLKLGPRGEAALLGLLRHRDTKVVAAAVEALGMAGPRFLSHLRPLAASRSALIRRAVAPSLAQDDCFAALAGLAHDPDDEVRTAAAESLVQLLDARAFRLLEAMTIDRSPAVRKTVAGALSSRGAQAFSLLVVRLDDPEPSVRQVAAESLARLGDSRALVPLSEALAFEEDWETRLEITRSIRRLRLQARVLGRLC